MKHKRLILAERYATALEGHLAHPRPDRVQALAELGREAVALGIEVLGMARIHEAALNALAPPLVRSQAARAAQFFDEVTAPLMEHSRSARSCRIALTLAGAALNRRTSELAASRRMLQRGLVQRRKLEASLKSHHQAHAALLGESLRIQDELRQLTRRMILVQERQRRYIGQQLEDEIAQSMIGINLWLTSLKSEAGMNASRLKDGLAQARRQVLASVRKVQRPIPALPRP
jgi:hypothetical protein